MKKTSKTPIKDSGVAEIDPGFAPVADTFSKDRQVSRGKMFGAVALCWA